MLLFLTCLVRFWPFEKGRNRLKRIVSKIRRSCYGGMTTDDMMVFRAQVFNDVRHLLSTAKLHAETFKGYKGIFEGKNVVLVGAGPSVAKFKPMKDVVYIGLNRACSIKEIPFDYLFAIDNLGIRNYYKDIANRDCVKFIGDQGCAPEMQISESVIPLLGKGVRRYRTDSGHLNSDDSKFAVDLETEALGNFFTVAMQAMQFALYGNPDKIYLVGIDCSTAGHFDADKNSAEEKTSYVLGAKFWADGATRDWAKLKVFAETYYPGTEIVSINPVGLKGLFTDIVV